MPLAQRLIRFPFNPALPGGRGEGVSRSVTGDSAALDYGCCRRWPMPYRAISSFTRSRGGWAV